MGGVNERKYRLVNHEGKDITPEELVDRYLYNPEVCFKESFSYSGARSKNTALPLACSNILKEFSNNNKEESSSLKGAKDNKRSNEEEPHKPLEEWKPEDFPLIGCIYCINNSGYHGPLPLAANDYERHIVKKHPGKPAVPGLGRYQIIRSNS